MSGGDTCGARLLSLEEVDAALRAGRVPKIDLVLEDVILLLLGADRNPVQGVGALTAHVFLAVAGPLSEYKTEPIAFRRGRGGRPRSEDVEDALDALAFTANVSATGCRGRGGAGIAIAITPKGRRRIAKVRSGLPDSVREALARQRAESRPACTMDAATHVHNRDLLAGLVPEDGPKGGGARRAGPGSRSGPRRSRGD